MERNDIRWRVRISITVYNMIAFHGFLGMYLIEQVLQLFITIEYQIDKNQGYGGSIFWSKM